MELLVPQHVLDALAEEKRVEISKQANERVDQQTATIHAAVDRMVAIANGKGARDTAAAALLLRAVNVLDEVRAGTATPVLQHLGIRSAFELAVVGRYFLVAENGHDEFIRRYKDSIDTEDQLGEMFNIESPGPVGFLEGSMHPNLKDPRKLRNLAQELDGIDGYPSDSRYSAENSYGLIYKHLSNMVSHANLSSVKYHVGRDPNAGVLFVQRADDVTDRNPTTMIVACFIGELAEDVFRVFELPTDDLPSDVRRPAPEEIAGE